MLYAASLSLQGKRNSNQDRILVTPAEYSGGSILAAVADGLGGMKSGDKAAEIAVETLQEASGELLAAMNNTFADASDSLADIYQRANDRIRSFAETHGQAGAVGTTLVSFISTGSRSMVMNIGDSRCYRIDGSSGNGGLGGNVHQITVDHTVADELMQQGAMTEREYSSSPLRNQLTKCLGPKMRSEPDIFPEVEFGVLQPGATFLLCSDGFFSKLRDEDLAELRGPASNLNAVLEKLAAEALARGSSDNISAVAIRYG
jgi:serine/threonine protein phosphatase PrpC